VLDKGKVLLRFTSGKFLCLNNVLYVPSLRRNLVSGSLLDIAGFEVNQKTGKVMILRNGVFIGKGYHSGGLYVLNITSDNANETPSSSAYIAEFVNLWHSRLGHFNFALLKRLRNMRLIPNVNADNFSKCDVCVEAKFAKKPFKSVTARKTELLELVHSDLANFKNTISKGGKKWYIIFVDDYSRYTKVYLLKSKDEAEKMFLKYKAEVENQLDRKIKRLRSDRGRKYGTNFLTAFCEKNGITHETSAPYIPQQNGIAE